MDLYILSLSTVAVQIMSELTLSRRLGKIATNKSCTGVGIPGGADTLWLGERGPPPRPGQAARRRLRQVWHEVRPEGGVYHRRL